MQDQGQIPMFVDDLNEAIRAAINELGGFKTVGAKLKPEKSPVDAGKWLADCLNPAKRERLDPDQLALIRRDARVAGCHVLASFEMREAGYSRPTPVAPADEAAELRRAFLEGVRVQQELVRRLERLTGETA
jgi:hypothetical protein